MDVTFHEKYVPLSDMTPGQSAVSQDRDKFFVCGLVRNETGDGNTIVILNMNHLYNQYPENLDMTQPVKILKGGDKFTCSA